MEYLISLLSSNEFFDNVVIGLLGGFVLKSCSCIYQSIVNIIYKNNNFSISGIWYSSFSSYINNKINIELVCIKQRKESIILYLEQYSNVRKEVKKYRGKGVFRGGELSLVYYPSNKDDMQNGVFVLKVVHSPEKEPNLVGVYAEFSYAENDNKANIEKGDYRLIRFDVSFLKRLLFYVRGSYFRDYYQVKKYIENCEE